MFNEELNIEHAITAAVEACTKYTDDYEIIIVDDASTDRSAFLVARRAAESLSWTYSQAAQTRPRHLTGWRNCVIHRTFAPWRLRS